MLGWFHAPMPRTTSARPAIRFGARRHRPRIGLTIWQRTRVLDQWPAGDVAHVPSLDRQDDVGRDRGAVRSNGKYGMSPTTMLSLRERLT